MANEFLPVDLILLTISNYVSIDSYFEKPEIVRCPSRGRKRRLLIEASPVIIEIEYPKPFTEIDWSVFNKLPVKVETIPEFINDSEIRKYLKDFT